MTHCIECGRSSADALCPWCRGGRRARLCRCERPAAVWYPDGTGLCTRCANNSIAVKYASKAKA
jgi:hypothetical protein